MNDKQTKQLIDEIKSLPEEKRRLVFSFVLTLRKSEVALSSRKAELKKLAGCMDAVSAREMRSAIEDGCEQVDISGW